MTLITIFSYEASSFVPVFYYFKNKIKKHLIFSKDLEKAENFKKGIEKFCKKYNLDIKNYVFSLDEIDKIPFNSFVNISDAPAFLIYNLSKKPFTFIDYDIFENTMNIIGKKRVLLPSVSVEDFFLLKNIKIQKENKNFAKKYKDEIIELFEKHHKEFNDFKIEFTKTKTIPNNSKILKLLKKMDIKLQYNKVFKLITGTLFEYYVYLKLKNLGFDDIEIGVRVLNKSFDNEFDLLVMHNNHLNIVECKHKEFNLHFSELIYKYFTLRNIIDYDARAVIVSLIKNYNLQVLNRALEYKIGLFDITHIDDIEKFLKYGEYEKEKFIKKGRN